MEALGIHALKPAVQETKFLALAEEFLVPGQKRFRDNPGTALDRRNSFAVQGTDTLDILAVAVVVAE
jgi:hypothetical protein